MRYLKGSNGKSSKSIPANSLETYDIFRRNPAYIHAVPGSDTPAATGMLYFLDITPHRFGVVYMLMSHEYAS